MLHIIFGDTDNVNYGPDWFKNNYDPEWLKDAFIQEMIKDVDKSDYVDGIVINSPILGAIPPERLDYSGAAEPPFRENEYRESGIAYRQSFSCCASLLA